MHHHHQKKNKCPGTTTAHRVPSFPSEASSRNKGRDTRITVGEPRPVELHQSIKGYTAREFPATLNSRMNSTYDSEDSNSG